MKKDKTVFLIHGMGGSRIDMWPISRRLRSSGYQVENWGYRTLGNQIESIAERLGNRLRHHEEAGDPREFHLVTHSMGGIVARTLFEKSQYVSLRRVVMLAPPHRGSHAARTLAPFLGWLTPTLKQLSDEEGSYVNSLANSFQDNDIEFGIIEATKDRVIRPGGVQLDGSVDFAKVDGHHGILTWYSQTLELVENFLEYGEFVPH